MLNGSQVKADLKEIRYYYQMKQVFDSAKEIIQPKVLLSKVDRYNSVIKNAPAKLFIIYYSLYVENKTHEGLAEEWGKTWQKLLSINKS